MNKPARDRIIIPLDVSSAEEAAGIVTRLKGRVGMFKVGLQLYTAAGPDAVRRITGLGERVFLDLKLHDIPNTVARAAAEAARLGVAMLDFHLGGGARMVTAAREAVDAAGLRAEDRPILLGITVLTSFDQDDLRSVGVSDMVEDQVTRLARLGRAAGLDGVVASPHEVAAIRAACGQAFVIVTPGIRPAGASRGDQRRVMTPGEAIAAGSDYLVIGRPILESANPVAAVEEVVREISS